MVYSTGAQVQPVLQQLTDASGLPNKDIFVPIIPATLATLDVDSRLLIAATPDRFRHIKNLSTTARRARRLRLNKLIRQCDTASHEELLSALDSTPVDKAVRLPGVLTVFGARGERKSRCGRCRSLFDASVDGEMARIEERAPDMRVFPKLSCCENEITLLCALAGLPVDVVG